MARPISTEHEIGASVWLPCAFKVMRELAGSCRYRSFKGRCSVRTSMNPPKVGVLYTHSWGYRGANRMSNAANSNLNPVHQRHAIIYWFSVAGRSEERRVGKECRS